MKFTSRWEMPEVTFYQVEDHGFSEHEGKPLYAYGKPDGMDHRGMPRTSEMYDSLDRALVSWVAEKYTGPRGAGGTGVGTAADWFMKMIGADELVEVDHRVGQEALQDALMLDEDEGPIFDRARAITDGLEKRGLVIARMNRAD